MPSRIPWADYCDPKWEPYGDGSISKISYVGSRWHLEMPTILMSVFWAICISTLIHLVLNQRPKAARTPKKAVGAGRKGRNRNREVETPSDEQRCNLGRTGKRLEHDPWISWRERNISKSTVFEWILIPENLVLGEGEGERRCHWGQLHLISKLIKFSGLVLQVSKLLSPQLSKLSELSKTTILRIHEPFPGDEYETTSLYPLRATLQMISSSGIVDLQMLGI